MNWCMALVELAQNKHPGVKRELLALSPDNKRLLCKDRREVLTALNTVASKRAHPSATRGANGTSRTDIIWPNLLRALYNRGVCFVPASRHSVEGAFIRKSGEAFVPLGKSWADVDLDAIFKSDRKKRRRTKRASDEDAGAEKAKRPAGMKRSESDTTLHAAAALVAAGKAGKIQSSRISAAQGSGPAVSAAMMTSQTARMHQEALSQALAARNAAQHKANVLNSLGSLQSLSKEALTQLVVQLQVRLRDAEMREVRLRDAVVRLQQENGTLRQQAAHMEASLPDGSSGLAGARGDGYARPRGNSIADSSSLSGAVACGGRLQGPQGNIPPGPPTAGGGSVHGAMMPGLMSPQGAGHGGMVSSEGMTTHEAAALMLMGGATPGAASATGTAGGLDYSGAGGRRGSVDFDGLQADAAAAQAAMRASEAAAASAEDATGIRLHAPRLDGGASVGPPTLGGGDTVIGYTPRDRKRPVLTPGDEDMEACEALHALSGGHTPAHAEDRASRNLAAAAAMMSSSTSAARRPGSAGSGFGRHRLRSRSEADRLM